MATEINTRRNFTGFEKNVILELTQKYADIVENKSTDNVTVRQKNEIWKTIGLEYNAIPGVTPRTVKQLWYCYKNLKKKAVKEKANYQIELYRPKAEASTMELCTVGENQVSMDALIQPLKNIRPKIYGCPHVAEMMYKAEPSEEINETIIPEVVPNETSLLLHNTATSQPDGKKQSEEVEKQENQKTSQRKAVINSDSVETTLMKEEHELKMMQMKEEHNLKMAQMKEQHEVKMKINEKILDILKTNPSALTLYINNLY